MTRPIKFRAWLKEKKVMANYVSHFKHDPENGVFEITVPFDESGLQTFRKLHSIDQFDLMQFTSLLDKNGKEIYEGDIIVTVSRSSGLVKKRFVEWNDNSLWYELSDGEDKELLVRNDKLEIIGNIYSNPELLK